MVWGIAVHRKFGLICYRTTLSLETLWKVLVWVLHWKTALNKDLYTDILPWRESQEAEVRDKQEWRKRSQHKGASELVTTVDNHGFMLPGHCEEGMGYLSGPSQKPATGGEASSIDSCPLLAEGCPNVTPCPHPDMSGSSQQGVSLSPHSCSPQWSQIRGVADRIWHRAHKSSDGGKWL